jgi:probable F420-dependent oxidoreductase
MAAAAVTRHITLSTYVLNQDFRPPAILAQEAASVHLLTGGRLELGVGAGWLRGDYEVAGLRFDPPGVRLARLEEAAPLLKRLLAGEAVTHAGAHYQVRDLALRPAPAQRPPLFLGSGGERGLSLAARKADIVGLDTRAAAAGTKDVRGGTADVVAQKVAWVRRAAGARFDALELHMPATIVEVTDDRRRGAETIAGRLASWPATMVSNPDLGIEEILESPHLLGSAAWGRSETLQARRERYGISYITVPGGAVDAFAPVVARLAGT